MSPMAERLCDSSITTRSDGVTWICGRPWGHATSDADDPTRHECIGQDHPSDGRTYRVAWYGPELTDVPA